MCVRGSDSSAKLWTAVQQSFGVMNKSKLTFLTSELQRTRKGSLSMDQYLSSIKSWADNLELVGKVVGQADLVTQVLAGLNEEYTPIVVQLNSKSEISWHELTSVLLTFESTLDHLNQIRIEMGSINLSQVENQTSFDNGRGFRESPNSRFNGST